MVQQINATLFLQMMQEGAKSLQERVDEVNALNVFPVPDGDTGTNMSLTLNSGVKEMEKQTSVTLGSYADALSKGLLMGARGNSGVILSQLFRGFSKSVIEKTSINGSQLAEALHRGVQTAYKAVIKPVEGTILTVARQAADAGMKITRSKDEVIPIMEAVIDEAVKTLSHTPQMLPVLKQAGVVDAGGKGLVFIFEGMLSALKGEVREEKKVVEMKKLSTIAHKHSASSKVSGDIEFGYCTEFIVRLNKNKHKKTNFKEEAFKEKVSQYGDSLLVVADDELVKIHIHAEYPGEVMNYAMNYGDLISIKIDNMRAQNEELSNRCEGKEIVSDPPIEATIETKEEKEIGIIAVASGEGISAIFNSLGVDEVIEGGQSMNPSTEELVRAIENVGAKNIFILPNNKNILLTAEQVQEVTNIPVTVIPTHSIPQGLSAMLALDVNRSPEENKEKMVAAYRNIHSGEVTHAVRNSKVDGKAIKEGDILGIREGKIEVVGKKMLDTSLKLLQSMISEDTEIVTILYGQDLEEKEANKLNKKIQEKYPSVEVEVQNGGQPLYSYLFSVE